MARWKKTTGEITETEIMLYEAYHGGPSVYLPYFVFRYTVDNVQYEGNNHTTNSPIYRRQRANAQKILDRYPVGSTIAVYYPVNAPADFRLRHPLIPCSVQYYIGTLLMLVIMEYLIVVIF